MKIDSGASYLVVNRAQNTNVAGRADGAASFAATLAGKTQESQTATAGAAGVSQADFSNMTRQEMFDWMNDQIRSGKMSFDERSPFLGMTMKISVATGQPVDMATDTTRINFPEKARLGIEGALSRNDPGAAKRLQAAIDIMLKNQEQTVRVGTRV
jgi:hypothetical protein